MKAGIVRMDERPEAFDDECMLRGAGRFGLQLAEAGEKRFAMLASQAPLPEAA